MLRDQIDKSPQNNARFPLLPPTQTILFILNFLEQWLPFFPEIYSASQTRTSHLEDHISRHLNRFLQDKAKTNDLLLDFDPQKGVDFLIWVRPYNPSARPLFLIEAKRLPPTNNKDYAQGRTGGIERFKREQEGFDQHVTVSAMLGYVQENNFAFWHHKVNTWIEALIQRKDMHDDIQWEQQDLLREFSPSTAQIARYISTHSRKTRMDIELHHFWLNIQD